MLQDRDASLSNGIVFLTAQSEAINNTLLSSIDKLHDIITGVNTTITFVIDIHDKKLLVHDEILMALADKANTTTEEIYRAIRNTTNIWNSSLVEATVALNNTIHDMHVSVDARIADIDAKLITLSANSSHALLQLNNSIETHRNEASAALNASVTVLNNSLSDIALSAATNIAFLSGYLNSTASNFSTQLEMLNASSVSALSAVNSTLLNVLNIAINNLTTADSEIRDTLAATNAVTMSTIAALNASLLHDISSETSTLSSHLSHLANSTSNGFIEVRNSISEVLSSTNAALTNSSRDLQDLNTTFYRNYLALNESLYSATDNLIERIDVSRTNVSLEISGLWSNLTAFREDVALASSTFAASTAANHSSVVSAIDITNSALKSNITGLAAATFNNLTSLEDRTFEALASMTLALNNNISSLQYNMIETNAGTTAVIDDLERKTEKSLRDLASSISSFSDELNSTIRLTSSQLSNNIAFTGAGINARLDYMNSTHIATSMSAAMRINELKNTTDHTDQSLNKFIAEMTNTSSVIFDSIGSLRQLHADANMSLANHSRVLNDVYANINTAGYRIDRLSSNVTANTQAIADNFQGTNLVTKELSANITELASASFSNFSRLHHQLVAINASQSASLNNLNISTRATIDSIIHSATANQTAMEKKLDAAILAMHSSVLATNTTLTRALSEHAAGTARTVMTLNHSLALTAAELKTNMTAYISNTTSTISFALDTVNRTLVHQFHDLQYATTAMHSAWQKQYETFANVTSAAIRSYHDHLMQHTQQILVLTNASATAASSLTYLSADVMRVDQKLEKTVETEKQIAAINVNIDTLQVASNATASTTAALEKQQVYHERNISSLSTSVQMLDSKLKDVTDWHNSTAASTSSHLLLLQQQQSQTQHEVSVLSAASASTTERMSNMQKDIDRIDRDLPSFASSASVSELSNKIDKLEALLEMYEKRLGQVEAENERLRNRCASTESQDELRRVVYDIQTASMNQNNKVIELIISSLGGSTSISRRSNAD